MTSFITVLLLPKYFSPIECVSLPSQNGRSHAQEFLRQHRSVFECIANTEVEEEVGNVFLLYFNNAPVLARNAKMMKNGQRERNWVFLSERVRGKGWKMAVCRIIRSASLHWERFLVTQSAVLLSQKNTRCSAHTWERMPRKTTYVDA